MYSRVTEFQSSSKTHCDMIIAFFSKCYDSKKFEKWDVEF